MNTYTIGAIALGIIVIIIIVFLMSAKGIPASSASVDGPFQLSSSSVPLSSSAFPNSQALYSFLKDGTGTFQAYIYLDSLSQTGSVSSCGTSMNQPSCSSGLYDPCTCTTKLDCTNCMHNGYKKLFSLYNVYNLEVLPFPDASRQNSVSTQLAIETMTAEETFIETIPLPPLPLQKWTMFTLSRTGRRVDIYYNSTLVVSKTLLNMTSNKTRYFSPVSVGQVGLSGSIGLISMNSSSATIGSVASQYSQTSDTRGAPTKFEISLKSYTNKTVSNPNPGILSSLCLDGSCLHLPRVGNVNASLSQFTDSLSGLSNSANRTTVSPAYNVRTQYI
jgi:hypothetical protein